MARTPRPSGPGRAFARLRSVVQRLRGPRGCPWDREQTVASVRRYLLEEAYEAVEVLEGDGPYPGAREELADLLFQIAFLAQLFAEKGEFDLAGLADQAAAKMVARHPHVFGGRRLATAGEVLRHWSVLKAEARGEKPGDRSLLDGVPRALPALAKALELTDRAARVGFDWPDTASVLAKLEEESDELKAALRGGDQANLAEEIGDLLFVVANLARKVGADPEEALQRANRKFRDRFQFIESELASRGRSVRDATLPEMDALWDEAKRRGL